MNADQLKIYELLRKIEKELREMRKLIDENQNTGDWITRKKAMLFLGYKETTMRNLEKSGELTFSQIGRRKFVKRQELIDFLERRTAHFS